jgi:glycosyltransferase involved in cell wall biosynthesis
MQISVVVTTYNRKNLLSRALDSIFSQKRSADEVLIVDDCSSDETPEFIQNKFPDVKIIRHERNSGPSVARNTGLANATGAVVVFLDDDDQLLEDALFNIEANILQLGNYLQYPVFQFAHSNGRSNDSFCMVSLQAFCNGSIQGDFLPVINRELFLNERLAYPDLRCGGENILWWEVADRWQIPTWDVVVSQVNDDAPIRLTSADNQLLRASEYAEIQERIIRQFGDRLGQIDPLLLRARHLGAAVYWLLSGKINNVVPHRRWLKQNGFSPSSMLVSTLGRLPTPIVQKLFSWYRQRQVKRYEKESA